MKVSPGTWEARKPPSAKTGARMTAGVSPKHPGLARVLHLNTRKEIRKSEVSDGTVPIRKRNGRDG
jgi:hypothetical protein